MTDADRARLLAMLRAHAAQDAGEQASLDMMLDLAARLPEPFSREQLPGHFTASALVLDPRGRVLLIHHRKLGRWLQPGGHIDAADGMDLVAAALREVAEETGIAATIAQGVPQLFDVDAHLIPARPEMPSHHHLDLRFLARCEDSAITVQEAEATDARFVPLAQAILKTPADDPGLTRMLRKARE
jgi:8-oxo-dGTP pyrophosphatase MutT (NUDIX family)